MHPPTSMQGSCKFLKWSQNCEATKILVEGVASGEHDLSLHPKQTHNMHPKFSLHNLNAFGAQVNKLRAAKGQALTEHGECP